MTATIDTVLNLTQFNAAPVRMRYSFDHMVKASEDGEQLTCMLYITLNGTARYVKLIDGNLVLKSMCFNKPTVDNRAEFELLEAYAQEVYNKMVTDVVDVNDTAELTGKVMGHLTELNRHIRKARPDLDVRTINATGMFATAYPSTEELINGLDALEKKIEKAEKPND